MNFIIMQMFLQKLINHYSFVKFFFITLLMIEFYTK